MKKLSIESIRGLCSFGILFFVAGPFFKIQTGESYTGEHVPYILSGFNFVFENVDGYFTNAIPAPNRSLVIISFTVVIVMLMQLVAGLIKREKLIISTAVIMTGIMLAGLVYIMQSTLPVVIQWGYYVFIVLQLVLAIFTPLNKEAAKS